MSEPAAAPAPSPSSHFNGRLAVGVGLSVAAWPALAELPTAFASPLVTGITGFLGMSIVAGGIHLLLLRRRLAQLEGAAAPAVQSGVSAEPQVGADKRDRHFRLAAESGHGLEGWIDLNGRLDWINPAVERCTGFRAEEVLDGDFVELLIYERDRRFCREQTRTVLETGSPADFELRLAGKQGVALWVACHWQPIRDEAGQLIGLRVTMDDIQARKEAEYKLLESVAALRRAQALSEHYLRRSNEERSRLSALLDVVRMGILFMDVDRRVVYCNAALYEIWGLPPGDKLVGVRDVVLQQFAYPLLLDPAQYQQHVDEVLRTREQSAPFEIHFKDGRVVTDFSRVVPGPDGSKPIGRMWVYEDVTRQRQVAAQLLQLAERDPLTNLYNRRRFHDELGRLLAESLRRGVEMGLLVIDLDGFKPVNDRFGHQAGDEVLVRLASVVGAVVRRNELFFRLGGDEFAILVPSCSKPELAELARRVCQCVVGLVCTFANEDVAVSTSIGIALAPRHGRDGERVVAAADRAMYRAKAAGGNGWQFAREPGLPEEDVDLAA